MLNTVRRCWDELLALLWRAIWRIRRRRAVTRRDTPISDERIVRLFVSSTFRDMHDERATLQRAVFPAVRRALRARGVQFVEVDLRWGVTREEVERGDVISICLKEIDRCRPWILGLLGGYYGYIDQQASQRIAADPAFARLEPFHRESVTALELRHAITQRPAGTPDPAALVYSRPTTSTPSPYSDLGREMAQCGVAVRDTPPDLQGFAAAVRKELIDLVVGRLDGRVVEPHEVLARARLLEERAAFVDRPELSLLLRLVSRRRSLVAVVGPEGVGKSALIAALGRAVQEARLMHLVPVLAPGGFRNWIGAFKTAMAILGQSSLAPAVGPGDLARSFHTAAEAVATVEPLCVLFDDIDIATVESTEAQLAWLPRLIRHVTIVTALRGGDAVAEHARNLGYDVIRLAAPDRRLAATMVEQRLLTHGRRLPEHQTAQLIARPRSARGHLLACEELRQVDRFEDVEGVIVELSGIETTLELGERAARRIVGDRGPWTSDVLLALAISENGLADDALQQIARDAGGRGALLDIRLLREAIGASAGEALGRTRLVEPAFRDAVLARTDSAARLRLRRTILEVCLARLDAPGAPEEAIAQALAIGDAVDMGRLLARPDLAELLICRAPQVLAAAWTEAMGRGSPSPECVYAAWIGVATPARVALAAEFLAARDSAAIAADLARDALQRVGPDDTATKIRTYLVLARVEETAGRMCEAERWCRAVATSVTSADVAALARANILRLTFIRAGGAAIAAQAPEARRLAEMHPDGRALATVTLVEGLAALEAGKTRPARKAFRTLQTMALRDGDLGSTAAAEAGLARLALRCGKRSDAEQRAHRVEAIGRMLGDRRFVLESLAIRTLVAMDDIRRFGEARELIRRRSDDAQAFGDVVAAIEADMDKAILYASQPALRPEAEALVSKVVLACRSLGLQRLDAKACRLRDKK